MGTLKKLYTKLGSYLPTIQRKSRPSMWIVYIYGAGLIILFTFIIFSWVYEFIRTGNPNIQVLIDFFTKYTVAQVIAAFTFVSVFLVDKNNDGRPDAAEKEAKKELKKDAPKMPMLPPEFRRKD